VGEQKNQKTQDVNQLLKIRRDKLAELQADGKDPFQITKFDVTHHSQEVKDQFEDLEGKSVVLAGRMMSKRVMGKASFCNIQDLQGNIQSYVARDSIGEEEYKAFKKMDIGDIVGLEGEVFKTKTGEISIHASKVTLLSKSLQILPEKFHGLTNTDIRYRQRYVDLIMNADVKETFIKRSRIIKFIMDLPIVGTAVYNMQMRRENIEYLFTEKYFYNPFSVSKKTLDIYHEAAHLDECGGKYLLSSLDGFYLNADISRALNSINNSLFILEGRKTEERERTVEGYVRLNSAVEYDFIENTEKYPQMENPQAVLEYVDMFF